MLGMTRWTPWTELAGVHRDLDTLFNRTFGEMPRSQNVDAFAPAADVRRDGEKWYVSMALPGIAPEDVQIDIVGQTGTCRRPIAMACSNWCSPWPKRRSRTGSR